MFITCTGSFSPSLNKSETFNLLVMTFVYPSSHAAIASRNCSATLLSSVRAMGNIRELIILELIDISIFAIKSAYRSIFISRVWLRLLKKIKHFSLVFQLGKTSELPPRSKTVASGSCPYSSKGLPVNCTRPTTHRLKCEEKYRAAFSFINISSSI